jgi:hypothetical protein
MVMRCSVLIWSDLAPDLDRGITTGTFLLYGFLLFPEGISRAFSHRKGPGNTTELFLRFLFAATDYLIDKSGFSLGFSGRHNPQVDSLSPMDGGRALLREDDA